MCAARRGFWRGAEVAKAPAMRLPRAVLLVALLAGCIEVDAPAAVDARVVDAAVDATVDAVPGTFCPDQPGWVEGAACVSGEDGCALCSANAECCRHFLVCLSNEWQVLEAGPCEP
jgi:hypothetical protein